MRVDDQTCERTDPSRRLGSSPTSMRSIRGLPASEASAPGRLRIQPKSEGFRLNQPKSVGFGLNRPKSVGFGSYPTDPVRRTGPHPNQPPMAAGEAASATIYEHQSLLRCEVRTRSVRTQPSSNREAIRRTSVGVACASPSRERCSRLTASAEGASVSFSNPRSSSFARCESIEGPKVPSEVRRAKRAERNHRRIAKRFDERAQA